MAEYSIRLDEDHLVTTASRFRSQASSRFWRSALKLLCFVGLGGLFALCVVNLIVVPSLVLGLFLVLLAAGPRFDYWVMRRRFRRSPFYNTDMRVSLGPDGFASADSKSRVELAWSAFTQARRFADGFLVFSGPAQFYWWPDASLTSGSVAEVASLLRENVRDYHEA